jgi:hypothetical protein
LQALNQQRVTLEQRRPIGQSAICEHAAAS